VIRTAGLVLAVLLLAGCGIRPTGVVYAGDAPVATASGSPRSQVFFLAGGVLTPVKRTASPADPQQVFDALLKGPTLEERARGLSTELTKIRQISVHDLDGRALLVETIPPTLKLPPPAFAQIYCTGLLLSGQTVLKISYLDSGAQPYAPPACPGATATPSPPQIPSPSVPASGAHA
jgi:hypothetical protein